MAIYHLSSKIISRSQGRSAIAAAAYRSASLIKDHNQFKTFDYSKKQGVDYSEILAPNSAPNWVYDREKLWNAVETIEKRKDAQVAREIQLALPIELNKEQGIELVKTFVQETFVKNGMIADINCHYDHPDNPHAHILLTFREISVDGFKQKNRSWNHKDLLKAWRASWSEHVNVALKKQGLDIQIDHRSYCEQGIELIPTKHLGKSIFEMEKKGIATNRMAENRAIQAKNLKCIQEKPEYLLHAVSQQKTIFYQMDFTQSLMRYVPLSQNENEVLQKNFSTTTDSFSQNKQAIIALSNPSKNTFEETIEKLLTVKKDTLTADGIEKLLQSLEKNHSVVTDRLLAQALESHLPQTSADDFARAFFQLKASPELIELGAGDDGRIRYTTRRAFERENRLQMKGR